MFDLAPAHARVPELWGVDLVVVLVVEGEDPPGLLGVDLAAVPLGPGGSGGRTLAPMARAMVTVSEKPLQAFTEKPVQSRESSADSRSSSFNCACAAAEGG